MQILVSVVIPAFNEEKSIEKTLDSFVRQKTQVSWELILVDNASTDETSQKARKYLKKINLKIIPEPHKGRGRARATGVDHAKGGIILCADADTIYPPNWIENSLKYFENERTVAITGPWRARGVSPFTQKALWILQDLLAVYPSRLVLGHPWLTGFNMGFRKSAYEACGGFNKHINAHEDIDLTFKIRKVGKIVYARDWVVFASNRRFKGGIVSAFWQYQSLAIQYFVFRNKNIILSDKR